MVERKRASGQGSGLVAALDSKTWSIAKCLDILAPNLPHITHHTLRKETYSVAEQLDALAPDGVDFMLDQVRTATLERE